MKSSLLFLAVALGCASDPVADAQPREETAKPATTRVEKKNATPATAPEEQLGVGDQGVFSDLTPKIQLPAPDPKRADRAVWDREHQILTVYDGDWPLKVYPTGGSAGIAIDGTAISVRPGDAVELGRLRLSLSLLSPGATPPGGDADGDGIADALDLLIGAHKTVINGASYGAGYIRLDFPMGDVPRDVGVCTDVVIRAVRNVGVDLQAEVNRDIKRARRAYPLVRRPTAHIDHRRVKTILPYFKRHWAARDTAIDSSHDPLAPGDIVFMDTFPDRNGPDHIGIVSNRRGKSGHPLIINNWTDGTTTAEMDLLSFVPVTHRFRLKSR